MKKIETWLPLFPGFYGTVFEPYTEDEIYSINQDRVYKNLIGDISYDHCKFDYEQYESDIAEGCTNIIETELINLGIVSMIICQNVVSPKEYNFKNDSVNIEVHLSDENIININKFINDNLDMFTGYLNGHYKSYDGFMSFYSYSLDDWFCINDMVLLPDILNDKHQCGAILDFIIQEYLSDEGIDETDVWLYYGCEVYLGADNYEELTTKHVCSICNELIIDDGDQLEQIEKYKAITGNIPSEIKCNNCLIDE